jgi:chromosome segregation ATPase
MRSQEDIQLIKALQSSIESLQVDFDAAVKKYDEARAEVEQWRSAYDHLSKLCNDKVGRVTKDHDKARAEFNRLTKERDAARSEVEQLKQALHDARLENSGQAARIEELKKGNEIITAAVCSGNSIEVERAIQERDAAIVEAKRTRPEPSRLEIAMRFAESAWQNRQISEMRTSDQMRWALARADALIAAAKEGK